MNHNTIVDLHPYGQSPTPASLDGPVVGVGPDQGMARAASLVEEAFRVSQAHALGAFFDALVEDCLAQHEKEGSERALRVMARALEKVRAAPSPYNTTKLHATPVPK